MLQLIAQGLSNQEIADQIAVSEPTVRAHVSHILGKLHLASRTQAARSMPFARGWHQTLTPLEQEAAKENSSEQIPPGKRDVHAEHRTTKVERVACLATLL